MKVSELKTKLKVISRSIILPSSDDEFNMTMRTALEDIVSRLKPYAPYRLVDCDTALFTVLVRLTDKYFVKNEFVSTITDEILIDSNLEDALMFTLASILSASKDKQLFYDKAMVVIEDYKWNAYNVLEQAGLTADLYLNGHNNRFSNKTIKYLLKYFGYTVDIIVSTESANGTLAISSATSTLNFNSNSNINANTKPLTLSLDVVNQVRSSIDDIYRSAGSVITTLEVKLEEFRKAFSTPQALHKYDIMLSEFESIKEHIVLPYNTRTSYKIGDKFLLNGIEFICLDLSTDAMFTSRGNVIGLTPISLGAYFDPSIIIGTTAGNNNIEIIKFREHFLPLWLYELSFNGVVASWLDLSLLLPNFFGVADGTTANYNEGRINYLEHILPALITKDSTTNIKTGKLFNSGKGYYSLLKMI